MSNAHAINASYNNSNMMNRDEYAELYQYSIENNEEFWAEQGKRIDWVKPYTKVKDVNYEGDVSIKWYYDGTLNASYNCIDRHLPLKADKTALIWEGDNPEDSKHITYQELHDEVCKFANALKSRGVKKGDVVTIYMPMVVEAVYSMLACARIGAIHSVVFGGFSPKALKDRIINCKSNIVITANEGVRAGKSVPLKANVDEAIKDLDNVHTVFVFKRTDTDVNWNGDRDICFEESCAKEPAICPPTEMNAEDPLFILYTSGSTGQPKGVLHTTGGYMVYASMTHEHIFDYKDGDIYWCTADVGWVTGHSYIVYGPLANGATTLVFEGVPSYPDCSRFWQVIDKHNVNIFYTAPTAIRALEKMGDEYLKTTSRKSLRVLGSVGEPINEEAWMWYHDEIGQKQCPIVDTWWQTETGGILISPLPGFDNVKPAYASTPFFGIKPALVDNDGNLLEDDHAEGNLVITDSWPGQMRSVYGDHERFIQTYFSTFKGMYCTGDGAKRDDNGYRITGRVDDVINVSGHRFGTAEIEDALNLHPSVTESAVVGFPHDIKGQGIYVYAILKSGQIASTELKSELIKAIRSEIGPIATPDIIQFCADLPKTRSGKIMRRILRKIAENEYESLGDISTLADPSVVDDIVTEHKKLI